MSGLQQHSVSKYDSKESSVAVGFAASVRRMAAIFSSPSSAFNQVRVKVGYIEERAMIRSFSRTCLSPATRSSQYALPSLRVCLAMSVSAQTFITQHGTSGCLPQVQLPRAPLLNCVVLIVAMHRAVVYFVNS